MLTHTKQWRTLTHCVQAWFVLMWAQYWTRCMSLWTQVVLYAITHQDIPKWITTAPVKLPTITFDHHWASACLPLVSPQKALEMTREEYESLPGWKQVNLKKANGLFWDNSLKKKKIKTANWMESGQAEVDEMCEMPCDPPPVLMNMRTFLDRTPRETDRQTYSEGWRVLAFACSRVF